MAIVNNESLVKFGFGFNESTSKEVGMISFDPQSQAIYVGEGDKATIVTSSVKNAEWDAEKRVLTVTKVSGDEFTLDFSDVASAQGVNSLLGGLRADVSTLQGDASTLKGDVSTLKTDVSALQNTVGDANNGLVKDVNELKDVVGDGGAIDTRIENAVNAAIKGLNLNDSDEGELVKVDVAITDGSTMTVTVTDSSISAKIASDISAAIDALDSSAAGAGSYVSVDASIIDGKLVNINVIDTSIVTKFGEIDDLISSLDTSVSLLEDSVADLGDEVSSLKRATAGGVHFRGVYSELPEISIITDQDGDKYIAYVGAEEIEFKIGDIIIVEGSGIDDSRVIGEPTKEYILAFIEGVDDVKWVELGDVSPADQKISDISTRVNNIEKDYLTSADASTLNAAINEKADASALAITDASLLAVTNKVNALPETFVTKINGKTGDVSLGTASEKDVEFFATAAQGATADTAIQDASVKVGNPYLTIEKNGTTLDASLDVDSSLGTKNTLADSKKVKDYVDAQVSAATATLKWIVL